MIKAVIFDVGGVLHTNEMKFVYQDIISTLGLTKGLFDSSYNKLIEPFAKGEISEEKFWNLFTKATHATKTLPEESLFRREFVRRYKVNQDVIDLVKILKGKGYKLAVLSNTIKPHVEVNKKMGIYDYFPILILSNEVGLIKPDPRIYRLTLNRLRVEPSEAIFIDDKKEFVKAAENAGLEGIVFRNAQQLKKDLSVYGVGLDN